MTWKWVLSQVHWAWHQHSFLSTQNKIQSWARCQQCYSATQLIRLPGYNCSQFWLISKLACFPLLCPPLNAIHKSVCASWESSCTKDQTVKSTEQQVSHFANIHFSKCLKQMWQYRYTRCKHFTGGFVVCKLPKLILLYLWYTYFLLTYPNPTLQKLRGWQTKLKAMATNSAGWCTTSYGTLQWKKTWANWLIFTEIPESLTNVMESHRLWWTWKATLFGEKKLQKQTPAGIAAFNQPYKYLDIIFHNSPVFRDFVSMTTIRSFHMRQLHHSSVWGQQQR